MSEKWKQSWNRIITLNQIGKEPQEFNGWSLF
jgi:hypothetical protein